MMEMSQHETRMRMSMPAATAGETSVVTARAIQSAVRRRGRSTAPILVPSPRFFGYRDFSCALEAPRALVQRRFAEAARAPCSGQQTARTGDVLYAMAMAG